MATSWPSGLPRNVPSHDAAGVGLANVSPSHAAPLRFARCGRLLRIIAVKEQAHASVDAVAAVIRPDDGDARRRRAQAHGDPAHLAVLMDTFDDARQLLHACRSSTLLANVRARQPQRLGQACPHRQILAADAHRHHLERRAALAGEMRQIQAQHLEECRPATLEALELIVPIVLGREQRMHHAHHALGTCTARDRDLGRHRRRALHPFRFHVAEANRRLPRRHLARGADARSEVEAQCAAHAFLDARFYEPDRVARTCRHHPPHLLGRARQQIFHLDPAFAGSIFLDWHQVSFPDVLLSGAG